MNKVLEYTTVSSTKNIKLEEVVNNMIKQGWQPYWSPYLDRNGNAKQAMVVYDEPDTPWKQETESVKKPKKVTKGKAKDED